MSHQQLAVHSVLQKCKARKTEPDILTDLQQLYGKSKCQVILAAAHDLQRIEGSWVKRWEEKLQKVTECLIEKALLTAQLDVDSIDFRSIAMEHSLSIMQKALEDSVGIIPKLPPASKLAKASAPPKAKVPTNFAQLRMLWDKYRRMRYIPRRQLAIAERVRKAYLKRVQAEWVKHGEDFRSGETAVRKAAVEAIQKAAKISWARAAMIVETETTYYYNKTRRAVFDQSPDVSHYLFMAIRDHRTTEWCKTRHGLVYAKDDPLLKKETPAIHWNCRSELLPLTGLNPRHRALIDDPSRARRNNTCEPLPPEWTGR